MTIYANMLDMIGHTPMIRLSRIRKNLKSTLLGKLEFYNPTGSVKDRIALYMLEDAERQGKIKPGDTIVEPTSGNTGISLSFVCALKGYRMIAVMPEQMSQERKDMVTAFGAELVQVPSQGEAVQGTFTKEDLEATLAKAEELAALPHHFMPNQFANPANVISHQQTTAEEIWEATEGKIDVFVTGVGTSGTAMGVSLGLKEKNPDIKIYIVEPANSAVILGESPGYHRLQGIGEGFVPELLEHDRYDGIIKVSDNEAKATTCRLSRLEGIFSGYSAGANVFASLKLAEELDEGKTIVTLIPDSGMKYLSTELFLHNPDVCLGYCCTIVDPKAKILCAEGGPRCCILEPCL